MPLVFISYSSTDWDFVQPLAEQLRAAAFDIWLDRWEISGRAPYWEEIKRGIENCTHFLFVISPRSIESNSNPITELYHAFSLRPHKIIVPVLARETPYTDFPLPITPGRLQFHDFVRQPADKALKDVIRALASDKITAPSGTPRQIDLPSASSGTRPSRGSGLLVAGMIALLLLALGAGLLTMLRRSDSSLATPTATAPPTTTRAPTSAALLPGTERILLNGIKLVYVPSGCFTMGSSEDDVDAEDIEKPSHVVCLTRAFWIGQYEITNAQFQQFIDGRGYETREYWSDAGWTWKGSRTKPDDYAGFGGANQPRVGISWYEAEAFARWTGARLPTEAEWEYAARGAASSIYPWGGAYDRGRGNVDERSIGGAFLRTTTAVGTYRDGVSWVLAYDMAGNVWEWCADWFHERYYDQLVQDDPSGPVAGLRRVLRGGSWGSNPRFARSANRYWAESSATNNSYGVRIVMDN